MKGTVLFLDTVHSSLWNRLEENGWACEEGYDWSKEKTIDEIRNYAGIVIRSRFKIDASILQNASQLKFIARAGAGMENIDLVLAESMHIKCINAPEGNRNAVAEHVLGMLLALLNNIVEADSEVHEGIWLREKNRGEELDGKTVCIIGFGNTGAAFAKKLQGFDVTILAYDPYVKINTASFPNVKQVTMDVIFTHCDVVSLHVPLTDETNYLVNIDFLSKFSKPIYLINSSRGKVVSIADLVAALKQGKLKGVALDVLEFESVSFENISNEKLPEVLQHLMKFKNVILSPHVAGWTVESKRRISEVLADKIIALV